MDTDTDIIVDIDNTQTHMHSQKQQRYPNLYIKGPSIARWPPSAKPQSVCTYEYVRAKLYIYNNTVPVLN